MTRKPATWEVIAARITRDTGPAGGGAPFGFATRVVATWRALQRDEKLRRWSLWSLRAALGSIALCGLVVFFGTRNGGSPLLIEPPSAAFLTPPLANP
ncbi:MAG: hypothetical protein WCP45_00260 [Verrucomicrobiota bacterium]